MNDLSSATDEETADAEYDIIPEQRTIEQLTEIEETNQSLEQLRRKIFLLQLYLDKTVDDILLKKEKNVKVKSFLLTTRYVEHSIFAIESAIRVESEVEMIELRQVDSTDGKDALLGSNPVILESILYNMTADEIEESEKAAMDIIKHEVVPSYSSRHDELATRIETGLERKIRLSHAVKDKKNTYLKMCNKNIDNEDLG